MAEKAEFDSVQYLIHSPKMSCSTRGMYRVSHPFWQGPSKQLERKFITKPVSMVADKHGLSHHAVTELLSAHLLSHGKQLDDYSVSVMTSKRKRDQNRIEKGNELPKKDEQNVEDHQTFLLQWDGKMLKGF